MDELHLKCSCGRATRRLEACGIDGCKVMNVCTGCNSDASKCMCAKIE